MAFKWIKGDSRTPKQIREHYEIEKRLAARLRHACRSERRHLYAALYDELYQSVPLHPQLTRRTSQQETARAVATKMKFLKRFLDAETSFLEVGPGDCALSFEVAKFVKQVYAVDVSDEITRNAASPSNFQCILSDGCSIPIPSESIHVAFSNQLMEHLHPDDALEQLNNICRTLVPDGVYICLTPNRLSGPHDISKHFDKTATGFHLKEYTAMELDGLFRAAGFSNTIVYVGAQGFYTTLPKWVVHLGETLLDALPYALKSAIGHTLPARALLGIRIVGVK